MHIMEGFLPVRDTLVWTGISLPFLIYGTNKIKRNMNTTKQKLLLGFVAAFCFVLSSLKIPSVTGSCSHPTGVGLGAILFGVSVMVPIAFVVLLFQALLLAHGGITTLGANLFSMGIAGPVVAFVLYSSLKKINLNQSANIFISITLSDLVTYVITSLQLALAFPDPITGFTGSFIKFTSIFAITQIPISIVEGLLSVVALNYILSLFQPENNDILSKQVV
ncbi:MAG: energy-coupling factor ABC transporter permease [Calditerrivibrio sp.]|nr:energy-coupling factor ABC transporter permease [Calditerrivibrio sp.]